MKTVAAALCAVGILSFGASVASAQSPPPVPLASNAPPPIVEAPSPGKLALARQVMEASGTQDQTTAILRNVFAQMVNSVEKSAPADKKANVDAIIRATNDALADMVPKLREIAVQAYAETYTDRELADMLAFFQSPSGRSMTAKRPQLMQMVMGQTLRMLPEIQRDMGEKICAATTCTPEQRAALAKLSAGQD
jgi:hypothetical protein